jgi:hypothetical protein
MKMKNKLVGMAHRAVRRTPQRGVPAFLVLFVLAAGFAVVVARAQQNASGHASDFTSVEYYEPPHQQQVKSRLSGAEASPQPGGLLVIKQLKVEMFDLNGKPEVVVDAPECVYDTLKGVATSPGRLQVRTGDGSFRVEGEGFLWRQSDSFLTISNHVRTVIEVSSEKKI